MTPPLPSSPSLTPSPLSYVEALWEQWLGRLVPGLPSFATLIGELRQQIKELIESWDQTRGGTGVALAGFPSRQKTRCDPANSDLELDVLLA